MLELSLGVLGVAVGSFLNVLIYRVPLKRSVISPPSACTRCDSPIKHYDNIPVISWLLLRGRCRTCRATISVRYPMVEMGTGIAFALTAWKFHGEGLFILSAFLYLAAVSVVLALVDLDTHTLPNRIVIPSYFVGAILLSVAGVLNRNYDAMLRAGTGMIALGLIYFALALLYPGGMGLGDVKFAGVLGLFLGYLGWRVLVIGAFAAFVLGGIFALGLLVARKAQSKSGIPFAPWMLVGAWVGVFFSAQIVDQYLSLFGITNQI